MGKNGRIVRRGFDGIRSGGAATAAMSTALAGADALGIMDRQPPRMIVEKLFPDLSSSATDLVALGAHLGYGSAAGVFYSTVIPQRLQNRASGLVYGAAIWAVGYEGWLPALGVLPPAHRDKPSRAATMFAAHLVYGYSLGAAQTQRTGSAA